MTEATLKEYYPNIDKFNIKRILKYKDKFQLTLDNLECINPDCGNLKAWKNSDAGFKYCCSDSCQAKMASTIKDMKITKIVNTISKKKHITQAVEPEVPTIPNILPAEATYNNKKTIIASIVQWLEARSFNYVLAGDKANILDNDIYFPDQQVSIVIVELLNDSLISKELATKLTPITPNAESIIEARSNLKSKKNNFLNTTNRGLETGIKVLYMYDIEWLHPNKQLIWKSMIINALGLSNRIYARKCDIIEIDSSNRAHKGLLKISNQFVESNHLQGTGKALIRFALFYQKELVSIMTFSKSRFDKNTDWELMRFCNAKGYSVVGGASRLLKAFKAKYTGSIKSYANRRWSEGNLYRQIGFHEEKVAEPNYFYWREDITDNYNLPKLHSRQSFQKHKLETKLEVYKENLTEKELVIDLNGYKAIFDSGNFVFKID
jgi:hypothetical protein